MRRPEIELRMLGPLEARIDGAPVALGGPKQRALVALLLLQANDVVPLDRLIDELWEGAPPPSAPAYVQNCVSRLRKLLGAEAFETQAPGYRLRIDRDAIDAGRFERLVRGARGMPTRERASALREALALWKGTPLSDLAYWSFAQDPIRRLEEQRLNALEMRLEAELELGLHRDSIGELDALAREHPTHERLRWLQMLALHRSDRRLDALAAYQEARLAIVEESGMEPGEELRALQRRILQDDPTLMPEGAPADAKSPPRLARKVVAVCIAELLIDEELDVEAARGVVSRGLASLEEIVLRHGGTVEQLLGEEALAVFGLPVAHEDDVLRALRSAIELRDALDPVTIRAAVETGEVLVGDDGRVLSGAALTSARRVKEGAVDGEILVGPAAAAQTAGAAWTEPSAGAHRLLELVEGASAIPRRPDAPLVGRRAELERLVLAVRESAAGSSCRRVVVVGEPGIGKTRLAAELIATVASEARILTGRCVPYADGATYLPLAEVVRHLADGDDLDSAVRAVLEDEPDGEQAASRLADALSGSGIGDSGDVFWATRKLLEALARERPVLVVLEDVHWAEPTFRDLLEYLAGWSKGAPITLLCLARPELLDQRPAWAADAIPLRPLADDETADLLDALPESLALDADARTAVIAAAEGNPLFLEQLAAHALDGPLEAGSVPASLESLLASRLDSLGPHERVVLERAAVVGRDFTRAAVDALAPDETRGTTATALMALARRRLVRPNTDRLDDDAFLFDHALIRDATYAALAKVERARLHERLARWLDRQGELDEIVGHHLEQAALNGREAGADVATLAEDAAERLGRAGERALWSLDQRTALGLLTRAIALLPVRDTRSLELECLRAIPLQFLGELNRALDLLRDAETRAAATGDRRLELRAKVEQVWPLIAVGEADTDVAVATVEEAIEMCGREGDALGSARAWNAFAQVESLLRRRFDAAFEAALLAERYYREHGATGWVERGAVAYAGDCSAPLSDTIEVCEQRLRQAETSLREEAVFRCILAELNALTGDLDGARALLARARAQLLDVGDELGLHTYWSRSAGVVEILGEDGRAAENVLRPAVGSPDNGIRLWRIHLLVLLAEALVLEQRHEEALAIADEVAAAAPETDLYAGLSWRLVRARACVGSGRPGEAVEVARTAVELVDPTDYLLGRGQARLALALALAAIGRGEEAALVAAEAERLLEEKGATLLSARARRQVAAARGGEPGNRAPHGRA